MTQDGRREAQKEESAAAFFCLLTVQAEGESPVRLVDNTQAVVSSGQEYAPCAFKCVLPSQGESGSQSPCRLTIDNTDRRISEILALTTDRRVTAEIKIVASASPDETEDGPYKFILRNAQITADSVSAELYDFYLADRNFPGIQYLPAEFPGLFA
ncbi:DUF1833 family protein [Treponema endosymbiont of Eucomonympha sp.]|uniref:DUF1833 family protein n=1 Tax=Treponema endosymbiont of Eucomonympha sp. TaxID=1580831 RepID=UPI0007513938|nr:DUF1833 family protein [Treponema endosymbiont of Eucomonympha sp.]